MKPNNNQFFSSLLLALLLVSHSAFGADLQRTRPENVGLSSQRLDRIAEVLDSKVKAGEIPGYVALVARRGKVARRRRAHGLPGLPRPGDALTTHPHAGVPRADRR